MHIGKYRPSPAGSPSHRTARTSPPGLKEINLLCWGLFCLCVVGPACFFLLVQIKTGKEFFRQSGVDFVYFYGTGEIVNSHGAAEVYDYRLQLATFNSIVTLPHGTYGPSPYPPFVPQFFRMFALLPFARAYFLWMAITFALYLASIVLLLREFFPEDSLKRSLILCFALAYFPFLRNTLASGQLSAVAFCGVALALIEERRSRHSLSGVLLAVLAYKFTLLLFIVPMLLLTRRWRALGGFAAGVGALAAISTMLAGVGIWPAYVGFLRSFGRTSGVYGSNSLQLQKYVDLNSFSCAIPGGRSPVVLVLLGCLAAGISVWAAVAWLRSGGETGPRRSLEWAVALTWTMLVNVYYPIYDSILIVIVVIVMLSAMRDLKWDRAYELIAAAAIVTFALSWVSESFADRYKVQLLTFSILTLAIAATGLLLRLKRSSVRATAAVPLAG